jgi:hypothetical protein
VCRYPWMTTPAPNTSRVWCWGTSWYRDRQPMYTFFPGRRIISATLYYFHASISLLYCPSESMIWLLDSRIHLASASFLYRIFNVIKVMGCCNNWL